MLAVGEQLLGNDAYPLVRAAGGFSGGLGNTRQELCGALSGGVMLIGALHGRTQPHEDDKVCIRLSAEYRQRFLDELGASQCQSLRASGYGSGSGGQQPCSELVRQAALILLDVLESEEVTP